MAKDKVAHAAYMREYYQRTKAARQQYQKERTAAQRLALAKYKSERGCNDCGERDARCLQFHHVDGKDFTIGSRCGRKGLESLLAEATKCEVVCANCHFKRHVEPYATGF